MSRSLPYQRDLRAIVRAPRLAPWKRDVEAGVFGVEDARAGAQTGKWADVERQLAPRHGDSQPHGAVAIQVAMQLAAQFPAALFATLYHVVIGAAQRAVFAEPQARGQHQRGRIAGQTAKVDAQHL